LLLYGLQILLLDRPDCLMAEEFGLDPCDLPRESIFSEALNGSRRELFGRWLTFNILLLLLLFWGCLPSILLILSSFGLFLCCALWSIDLF